MRIAWVAPARASSSRAGRAARTLVARLGRLADVELYVPSGSEGEEADGSRSRALGELRPRDHDALVYSMSNEAAAAFALPALRALGGTVWLHDWVLGELTATAHPALTRPGLRGDWVALCEGGWRGYRAHRAGGRSHVGDPPWNRSVVRWGDAFLVPSLGIARAVRLERNAPTPVAVLPPPIEARWEPDDRDRARGRLGIAPTGASLVAFAGRPRAARSIELAMEVLDRLLEFRPRTGLLLAGWEERLCERLSHATGQRPMRFPEELELECLRASDLAVHFGGPSTGEGLDGLAAALSVGRAVVAEAVEELSALPATAVAREADAPALAERIAEALDRAALREELERGARRFVEDEASADAVAARCLEALGAFPHARSARRPLLLAMLHARERARERG